MLSAEMYNVQRDECAEMYNAQFSTEWVYPLYIFENIFVIHSCSSSWLYARSIQETSIDVEDSSDISLNIIREPT